MRPLKLYSLSKSLEKRYLMNTKYTFFAIISAAIVAVSLSGCSNDSHDDEGGFASSPSFTSEDQSYTVPEPVVSSGAVLYINESTGLITKFVNEGGVTTFDENYSMTDTEIAAMSSYIGPEPAPRPGFESATDGGYSDQMTSSPTNNLTLDTNVEVNGRSYPTQSSLSWEYGPSSNVELIRFFNANMASDPKFGANSLKDSSLANQARSFLKARIVTATTDGTLPKAQFELTGWTSIVSDSRVADDAADQVPAWASYEETFGKTTAKDQFQYSSFCATYGVRLNGESLVNAADAMFSGLNAHFRVASDTQEVVTETEQPCKIVFDDQSPQD